MDDSTDSTRKPRSTRNTARTRQAVNQRVSQRVREPNSGKGQGTPRHTVMPDGLTEQARKQRERFYAKYRRDVEKALSVISLNILVWGPNPKLETPASRKRVQILAALQALGHNAMMSEDIPFGAETPDSETPAQQGRRGGLGQRGQKGRQGKRQNKQESSLLTNLAGYLPINDHVHLLRELVQAKNADFIILLVDEETRGVIIELDICKEPYVANKVSVLIPKTLEQSFTRKASLELVEGGNGSVYWYMDVELESCNVLTEAVRRVESRRANLAYAKERAK